MSDAYHKAEYQKALGGAGVTDAPAWEDLSGEQRERIRRHNRRHAKFMNDLGEAIQKGVPLPNPLARDPE